MTRLHHYEHEFVEFVPETLEPGVLYVSTTYATTAHLCMCGCGFEVTSPLTPQLWRMIFDGQTVSLIPSIGNWSFKCESHYWLERGTVDWAAKWSQERIATGREASHRRLQVALDEAAEPTAGTPKKRRVLDPIWRFVMHIARREG